MRARKMCGIRHHLRFLGLGLGDAVPDANTIWTFREALSRAGAIKRLFELFDQALRRAGDLAMSGQLVDATIISAPKQRNSKAEKQGQCELSATFLPGDRSSRLVEPEIAV